MEQLFLKSKRQICEGSRLKLDQHNVEKDKLEGKVSNTKNEEKKFTIQRIGLFL